MVANLTQPVIEVRGLSKVFKDFWLRPRVTAVDQLDLTVEPHQIFGLLGPNGSGKSTTIKIILGLLFATRGRVAVFGKLPSDVAIKKRIGYLPEESYLYRFLNARETLDYYGRLFHQDRHTRNKRIDMLLEMVGLEAVQRRPVGEYSKGMQRRIGLAQALINDPDLLILDEPTTGLDPIGTRQIKDLILHLKDRGKTVILSSHLLADVEDVCNRAVILYGGRKRAEGTIDELLTVEGTNLIETDVLKASTIARIERVIEEEEGKAIRRVDVPRQKLETLFLNIVHQAQQEGLATSGARTGGPVAEFLSRDAHLPEDIDGMALIDQLTQAPPPPSSPEDRGSEAAAEKEAASAVLDDLIQEEAERVRPPLASETKLPKKKVDRGVIDDLLGGKQS
ncbi:MAG: ABC transporter ATP-binding protein [Phycisphaerales bacterium]